MSNRIHYTDEDLGDVKIIEDFLPPPEELVLKQQNVKVTISLSRHSVDFFKEQAKKNGTQYQKMIRQVLDLYAANYGTDSSVKEER